MTAVETLLACPFKFFAERLLRIAPLDEIVIGISPLEKGETLHEILALITNTLRLQEIPLGDQKAVEKTITHCVHTVIGNKSDNPHWLVEKARLIGEEEGLGGLLGILAGELKRNAGKRAGAGKRRRYPLMISSFRPGHFPSEAVLTVLTLTTPWPRFAAGITKPAFSPRPKTSVKISWPLSYPCIFWP